MLRREKDFATKERKEGERNNDHTLPNERSARLARQGEPITYPKMVMTGQTGTRELAEYIAMTSGFSKGVTEGVICELGEALAHEMGMGRSVKIEGLGVFTPALSIYPDKEREQPQESSTKRNARSIYVSGVNFRTDKALIRETNHWCELERASWKPAHSSKKYTPEQRLALAHQYLANTPSLLSASTGN